MKTQGRLTTGLGVTLPYLALASTSLFWSGNWIIARAMRADIPPFALNFWRWTIASLLLSAIVGPEIIAARRIAFRHWRILVLLSATGVAGFHATVYLALTTTPAINALVLSTTIPIAIVIASWLMAGDKVSHLQLTGIVISACGALVLIARGNLEMLLGLSVNAGDAWMLLALPLWAVYSVALRWRPTELSPVCLVAILSLISIPILLPPYLFELYHMGPFRLTWQSAGTILYLAVFASVLAYILWNRGVANVGANRAGLFVHLMPVFGITLAVIFLGERPELYHATGMLLVFLGIYVGSRR